MEIGGSSLKRRKMRFIKKKRCSRSDSRMALLKNFSAVPEIDRIIREAEAVSEAAANYKLAPMHVKNYYIALYCDLLERYSEELAESGSRLSFSSEYVNISLYQDAEKFLQELSGGLIEIAFQRIHSERDVKGA